MQLKSSTASRMHSNLLILVMSLVLCHMSTTHGQRDEILMVRNVSIVTMGAINVVRADGHMGALVSNEKYASISLKMVVVGLPTDGKTTLMAILNSNDEHELNKWQQQNVPYDYNLYTVYRRKGTQRGSSVYELSTKRPVVTPRNIATGYNGVYWDVYLLRREHVGSPLVKYKIGQALEMAGRPLVCNDGIYCNGEERMIDGKCITGPHPVCQQDAIQTATPDESTFCNINYVCDEVSKSCKNTWAEYNTNCTSNCMRQKCKPHCRAWDTCGEDGCGGHCGSQVCAPGLICTHGMCQPGGEGTCRYPFNLAQLINAGQSSQQPTGNTYQLLPKIISSSIQGMLLGHHAKNGYASDCARAPADNLAYAFELIQLTGVHVRVEGLDANGRYLDTVVDVRKLDHVCSAMDDSDWVSDTNRTCNDDDDRTPSNGLGSRLSTFLSPGKYVIVVSGRDATQAGPFKLHLDFTPDCMASCSGKMCGVNECGVTCGHCNETSGQVCDSKHGLCAIENCQRQPCEEGSCGDDGCGNLCSVCKGSSICDDDTLRCVNTSDVPCNPDRPICNPASKPTGDSYYYCGDDCKWHDITKPLPDLTLPGETSFKDKVVFKWQSFGNDWGACLIDKTPSNGGISDGCIFKTGERFLMTFDTLINNVGSGDFSLDFTSHSKRYSHCTKEWYYHNLYTIRIYASGNNVSTPLLTKHVNRCIKDGGIFGERPIGVTNVECGHGKTCKEQGISSMAYHVNHAGEICQWVDITELSRGCWYDVEILINERRTFMEKYYGNNALKFALYIPVVEVGLQTLTYTEVMQAYHGDTDENRERALDRCKKELN